MEKKPRSKYRKKERQKERLKERKKKSRPRMTTLNIHKLDCSIEVVGCWHATYKRVGK